MSYMNSFDQLFESIVNLLDHVQEVEEDVKETSLDAFRTISKKMQEAGVEPDEELMAAFQYQDVLGQQLSATTEAIGAVKQHINFYLHSISQDASMLHGNVEKLTSKLDGLVETARQKRNSFSGHYGDDQQNEDEIEFF